MELNTIKKIDGLNIILLLLSFILAYIIPFRLFLLSYGVLGPLHYLTEIHWLRSKGYFINDKFDFQKKYLTTGVLIGIFSFAHLYLSQHTDHFLLRALSFQVLILFLFLFVVSLQLIRKPSYIYPVALLSYVLAMSIQFFLPKWILVLGTLMPTIIHVFIFTLLFMLWGAYQSKSNLGYTSFFLLLCSPIAFSLINIDIGSPANQSLEFQQISNDTGMIRVNLLLAKMTMFIRGSNIADSSLIHLKIQRFVTFSYTYHYLNWFSKTSIIGWKKSISKAGKFWILSIWIISTCIYYYDFTTGFSALFVLSTLHVILEFPLNILIIQKFGKLLPLKIMKYLSVNPE